MAFRAFLLNQLACTAAVRTGTDIDHLAKRCVLYDTLLACAVAVRACFHAASRFSAVAVAMFARFIFRYLNFHFCAKSSLFEGNIYIKPQIGTTLRAIAGLTTALAAKEGIENIFESAKSLTAALAKTTEAAKTAKSLAAEAAGTGSIAVLECVGAELVILRAFLFIGQYAVRFVDFFKLFFSSFRVVPVLIWMVLDS